MKQREIMTRNAMAHLRKERLRFMLKDCLKRAVVASRRKGGPGIGALQDDWTEATNAVWNALRSAWDAEAAAWWKRRSVLEPLFKMPPARRARVSAKPLTLVERRAKAAKRKASEWQRKQKLAGTKVKMYRKKVKYYTKKGVIG